MYRQLISMPELAAAIAVCVLAFLVSKRRSLGETMSAMLKNSPSNGLKYYLAIAVIGGVLPALGQFLVGKRQPLVHDEFSHLLIADLIGDGKVAAIGHPLPEFFETFHVLQSPAYFSKFPPAQGAFLAIGDAIFGEPMCGVWILAALFSMTIFWSLRAFVSSGIAGLTTFIVCSQMMVLGYWAQGYMGGAVGAIGGAVVVGCWRRLQDRKNFGLGLFMGLGLLLLAFSRPFEGLLFFLPLLGQLVYSTCKSQESKAVPALFGFCLSSILTGLLFTGYNLATTGDAFEHPHSLYSANYDSTPRFVWQEQGAKKKLNHKVMKDFEEFRSFWHNEHRKSLKSYLKHTARRFHVLARFLLSPLMILGLILAIPDLISRDGWPLITAACFVCLGIASLWSAFPHYAAPLVVVIAVLSALGFARLASWKPNGRPIGVFVVVLALAVPVTALVFEAIQEHQAVRSMPLLAKKAEMQSRLVKEHIGPHLVFVRYGEKHSAHLEWVYNKADLKNAAVLWARDMGDAKNRNLISHEATRQVWMLKIDDDFGVADFETYRP